MKARIQAKFENLNNQKEHSRKLLEDCKSWGGPCVSAEELQTILLAKPDIQDCIVKAELSYILQTHKSDIIAWTDLFKLNKTSNEKQLVSSINILMKYI